jgi:signal transduction histidine kinase
LILLDIMMPDMDGLATLSLIRQNPNTADIPVILISALADGQDVARGLEAGANDYITKPVDMDVTRARIQTQIALKQLQDERKQTIIELKAVQEMKDRLLRMASHDLKGPLGNIRMAITLIEEAADAIPDGHSLVQSVDASLNTMENVIKDFLDTAALQTGAIDLHIESMPLQPVIEGIISEHKINAIRKSIDLVAYGISGSIRADTARFYQALGNLVSNAIKYSPNGTIVTVWTDGTLRRNRQNLRLRPGARNSSGRARQAVHPVRQAQSAPNRR